MKLPLDDLPKRDHIAYEIKKSTRHFCDERYVIISVVGPHAGESIKKIFARKTEEIQNAGFTFWLYKSYNANPQNVQQLCKKALEESFTPLCLFIKASSKGGAQDTKNDDEATSFSEDGNRWQKIPQGVLVTGSIRNSFALVFNQLEVVEKETVLDLWNYSKFGSLSNAVQIRRGGSTICCKKESPKNDSQKMVSNIRRILAVGRLTPPFGVWLK